MNVYESVWVFLSQYDGILKYMIAHMNVNGSNWMCMKVYEAIRRYINV